MNPDKNDETDVPAGWELCISKKAPDRKYYFNRRTGESSWTKPQANTKTPEENKCKKTRGKPTKEEIKKILKRKCDGNITHSFVTKKSKEEKCTPEKPNNRYPPKKRTSTGSIKESPKFTRKRLQSEDSTHSPLKKSPKPTPSPAKRAVDTTNASRESDPSPNPTPAKNTANTRLSQLRASLNADAKNEEAKETTIQSAKPATPQKENKRSETNTSYESQTTHPHSRYESIRSTTALSQFFTANKIIYSMKAQLPDRDSRKPKDAFADIEEGINNQTTENPFVKHPATPSQFSEARKLISAINSKLSYRKEAPIETPANIFKTEACVNNLETPTSVYNVFKSADTPVGTSTYKFADMPVTLRSADALSTFRSANERMVSLRKRLSSEVMDTHGDPACETYVTEAMDVDPREIKKIAPEPRNTGEVNKAKENVILVVDTNIFIHELDFIKNIMNSHIEGYTEQPTLLVPWRVINELDKLKDSNNGNGAICKRARPAMDYLYKYLPENNNRIKVQPLRDANSHIYPCESPDDEILNCCLQQAERGKSVILLSNDKNLCTKAGANGVETKQLRALVLKPHAQAAATPLSAARIKKHIFTLLSNILENEMRAKYQSLWLRVVFKPPPWSLPDVLQCLLKHWIAVFNEVFPRIEYLIIDLKNNLSVLDSKGPDALTQSEVCNFKELCLEVATRCQIIPEYMQLATATVERLRARASESDAASERDNAAPAPPPAPASPPAPAHAPAPRVVDAFEGVWSVFSSYCAKLASALGVEHTVEDKLPGSESFEVLSSKLTLFGNQITALANTMEGVLNVADVNSPVFIENVMRLEHALKSSLEELGMNSGVSNTSLQTFCTKCWTMLQEAHGKFSDLVKLLTICQNNIRTYLNCSQQY